MPDKIFRYKLLQFYDLPHGILPKPTRTNGIKLMPKVYSKKPNGTYNSPTIPNPYLFERCNRPLYIISVKQMAVY